MTDVPATPVLDLLHPDLVDGDGNLVEGPPRPGLFAARAIIPIRTHGIIYHANSLDAAANDPEMLSRKQKYDAEAFEKLEMVIRDVSQREIGSNLLSGAYRKNIFISYNPDGLNKGGYNGSYNNDVREISIHPWFNRHHQNLIVVHELEHGAHVLNGLEFDRAHSFASFIFRKNVVEPAARTIVVLHAYENDAVFPDDRPWHYRLNGLVKALEEHDPYMAFQGQKFCSMAQEGNWVGFAGKLFEAASRDLRIKEIYDQRAMSNILEGLREETAQRFNMLNENTLRLDAIDTQKTAAAIQLLGQSYVDPKILKRREFVQFTSSPSVMEQHKEFTAEIEEYNEKLGLKMDPSVPKADIVMRARGTEYMARIYEANKKNAERKSDEPVPAADQFYGDVSGSDLKLVVSHVRHCTNLMLAKTTVSLARRIGRALNIPKLASLSFTVDGDIVPPPPYLSIPEKPMIALPAEASKSSEPAIGKAVKTGPKTTL